MQCANQTRDRLDHVASDARCARQPPRRSAGDRPAPTTTQLTARRNAQTNRHGDRRNACGWSARQSAQALRRSPKLKIDDDSPLGIRSRVGGVAASVDIAPDESGAAFGNAVHQCKIVGEIRHARIVDLVSNAADIELCKMMIGGLLQVLLRRRQIRAVSLVLKLKQDIAVYQARTRPEVARIMGE
jgi:hypothetical protein